MNIEYFYLKRRGDFGSPCGFLSDGPVSIDDVWPQKDLEERYVLQKTVDKGIQAAPMYSCNEVNTWRANFVDRGMNHDEGGWPKDLILTEEVILRYKKKIERDDNYIESMKALTKPIEHALLQNNAINIYQNYFDDVLMSYSVKETLSQIRAVFRDAGAVSRPISHLSWSPNGESMFVSSHCNTKFQRMAENESTESFVWDVELPNFPQMTFDCKTPIVAMEWNTVDRHLLAGGLYNGSIALFDTRRGSESVDTTGELVCHRDPVHSVLWLNTKSGFDFFSTSSDGVVKWWDCRNLSKTVDFIILDVSKNQNIRHAYGASCLEYDSTVPAKYLVGTENGYVICGNRKGTTVADKLSWTMKTHFGPLYALERNASFPKFYLTVGDWRAKIWTEETKESPIIWTRQYASNPTSGAWSRARSSQFFVTRADGHLDIWDLLSSQTDPFLSVRISDEALTKIRVEENGKFLIIGDVKGKVSLIQLAETLTYLTKNEKVILSAMFDRESRREKILETKMKEIRLAMKLKHQPPEESGAAASKMALGDSQEDENIQMAEENYWAEVDKVLEMEKKRQAEEKPAPPPEVKATDDEAELKQIPTE